MTADVNADKDIPTLPLDTIQWERIDDTTVYLDHVITLHRLIE
jgi:hypothetical protein